MEDVQVGQSACMELIANILFSDKEEGLRRLFIANGQMYATITEHNRHGTPLLQSVISSRGQTC